jgi:DNA-binding Lrp family transcriptional regulator
MVEPFQVPVRLSGLDREYSELMKELWGSPSRWNSRRSYADVARKLNVDEETVRNRLRRLRESGSLIGWRLVPNPSLFGRSSVMQYLAFDSAAAKERAVSKLERMDGVIVAASLYDTDLLVTLFDDGERSASKELASLGAERESAELSGMGLPQTTFRMTATDWQIARLMLRNAEKSIADVAAEIRVSARTVKRRLDRMMDASAIFVMPMIDQAKSSGISYQVIVESEDGKKSEVDRLVTSRIPNLVFKTADPSSTLIYGFSGRNIAEGKELLEWLRKQRGVHTATVNIVDRVVYVFDWLEREAAKLAG